MNRGEPEGNKPNVQDQDGAVGNGGGSVPPADGDRHGGADAMHLVDAQDAAPGDAAGDAGGDARGGAGPHEAEQLAGDGEVNEEGCGSAEPHRYTSLHDLPNVQRYLHRIGALVRSFKTAVVTVPGGHGYDKDAAVIRFSSDGTVEAPEGYEPDDGEAALIASELRSAQWPKTKKLWRLPEDMPDELKRAWKEDRLFVFREAPHQRAPGAEKFAITMLQERAPPGEERWKYRPWTHWDDGQWRCMEPEGLLPLWGMDQLLEPHSGTVFLHEGAKAARAVREMVEARTPAMQKKLAEHPWGMQLQYAAHLGWIGGALAPKRTDWSALSRCGVKRIYIVADHDKPGEEAIVKLAKLLPNVPTFSITFSSKFAEGFDLANEFPERLFRTVKRNGTDVRIYVGPAFADRLAPAQYLTEAVPVGPNGRLRYVLRDGAADNWLYEEISGLFINVKDPRIMLKGELASKALAPFSDISDIGHLLASKCKHIQQICYRPENYDERIIDLSESSSDGSVGRQEGINTFLQSRHWVKPGEANGEPHDVSPWLDVVNHLFPIEWERDEVLDWAATLIACPEVRMTYGILLMSMMQGSGKTSFTSALAIAVGDNNVSRPNENDILGNFNFWAAHKRLVIANEIYSGHSWKAYNALKTYVTDTEITVNKKFVGQYPSDCRTHIIGCSNSTRAFMMEEEDRRWFVPDVAETKLPEQIAKRYHEWLKSGLSGPAMGDWAARHGRYVEAGRHPPETKRKRQLIADSEDPEIVEARDIAKAMVASSKRKVTVVAPEQMRRFLTRAHGAAPKASPLRIGKAMRDGGMMPLKELLPRGEEHTVTYLRRPNHPHLSPAAVTKWRSLKPGEREGWLKEQLVEGERALEEAREL